MHLSTIYLKLNNMKKYHVYSSTIHECIVKYSIMSRDDKH